MAPVTRHFLESLAAERKLHTRVPLENKRYEPFRFVHCTLHLDQIGRNAAGLQKLEKLKKCTQKKSSGRIIRPLVFKPFKAEEILSKPTRSGNVTFIVEFDRLLKRFPRIYDNGIRKSNRGLSQSVLLSRGKRDLSRYTPLVSATPTCQGDIWWWKNEEQTHMKLSSNDSKAGETHKLELNIDFMKSDLKWFRKNWVVEYLDHNECDRHGELCPTLMDRSIAWQALHS